MFTIEMEHDNINITVLDDSDFYEDVIFDIFDDIVFVRQWNEILECHETITMSPNMFDQFCKALKLPDGAYTVK